MAYVKLSVENGGTVLLEAIRSLPASLTTRLREGLPKPPQEIELTFGIKASAEMNALGWTRRAGKPIAP